MNKTKITALLFIGFFAGAFPAHANLAEDFANRASASNRAIAEEFLQNNINAALQCIRAKTKSKISNYQVEGSLYMGLAGTVYASLSDGRICSRALSYHWNVEWECKRKESGVHCF